MDSMVPITQQEKMSITKASINTARKFLRYAFLEIDFEYDKLTETERMLCSVDEFNEMVEKFKLR